MIQPRSAKTLYEGLKPRRDPFQRRAEKSAAVTIPMLVPKEQDNAHRHQEFTPPRQSIGSRGVNHLSARLTQTMLPPETAFFRLSLDKEGQDILAQDPRVQAEFEELLRKIEEATRREIEVQGMRIAAGEIFKHLQVAGNVCKYYPTKGGLTYFPLSQYVVERDAEGDEFVLLIIREVKTFASLPEDLQEKVLGESTWGDQQDGENPTKDVEIFTKVWLEDRKYRVQQELASGSVIPKSEGSYSKDEVPYRPLRWIKVYGEAYGRSQVEEMYGDLRSLELLSRALVEGALLSSRAVFMVRPNSPVQPGALNKAKNGEVITGDADDVSVLTVDKHADFARVDATMQRVERRVEAAFLLNSSAIRDAERVTAEEIRFVAQELESTLGGVFGTLAQEFQIPLVRQVHKQLKRKGQIPEFDAELEKHVAPVIVTGVDALGRNAELDRLRLALRVGIETFGPEVVSQLEIGNVMQHVFTQAGVSAPGLLKSPEALQAEREQAQQQALLASAVDKGTGPAINAVSQATQVNQPQETN